MKKFFLASFFLSILVCTWVFWHASTPTLETDLSKYQKAGDEVKQSLSSLPALPITEDDRHYTIEDTRKDGIQITYANQTDTALAATPEQEKPSLTLRFPKQYASDPIEVQIAEGKSILIQDKNAKGDYAVESLSLGSPTSKLEINERQPSKNPISWLQSLLRGSASQSDQKEKSYLSYTDQSKRITTYYAYGHDQATGEKQLKNWQVYDHPAIVKGEQVAYSFTNAKLKKNENGTISVYYYGDQELQNDKSAAEVDPSLMARAQRTLAKDMGDSIDNGTATPSFVIPKPYYINSSGDRIDLDWRLSMDGKDISIDFTPEAGEYPIALDPTLSFTAPGMSNTGDVITGSTVGDQFGVSIAVGDFNSDGKMDLAVGALAYSSNLGRVYIFYQDNLIPSNANAADVIITGTIASGRFGHALLSGDFNSDGRDDLVVSALVSYASGEVYIFYNDGSYPALATGADVYIGPSYVFGSALAKFDANNDGRVDLVVGAYQTDAVFIFYNDGSISTADITITGSGQFGLALATGDFNSDGKVDLAVGEPAKGTPTFVGDTYIFYNDGSIPTTAATADVTITGNAYSDMGSALVAGDFNSDGRTDLAVGAYNENKSYIFYNDGSYPATTASADVTITGGNYFGANLIAGDFNGDGRTDLAGGATWTNNGSVFIFYNDGSIPTTTATADVIITGQVLNDGFGNALAAGDLNSDGKTDLAVGAYGYASATGRTYIFYSQNGQVNTNQNITGNASGDYFGQAMTTGDFNADGRIDLAVGAPNYSTNTGRVYLFYGDGQIPSTAGTADVTITGEGASYFGYSMTAGDLNADGRTDLAVGAPSYSTYTGRTYIFYNDGSIPATAATADVIITGQATNNNFGFALTAGDLNADGKTDLAVGAYNYSSGTGRAYIFYADGTNDFGTAACTGSSPTVCLAANGDIIITGDAFSYFGDSLIVGDLNADGRTDLVVGDDLNKIYIFYNDGSIPTTSATADVSISGFTTPGLGYPMAVGDFNADGRTDIAVGSPSTSASAGKTYIFYNDGSIPTTTTTADVIISGESNSYFGRALAIGDFNADGRTDLAVGGDKYTTNTGRTYIFYNDGSIPTTAATADVIITGETTNNYYGYALTAGDFNADGRADLVVGAYGNATNTGKVYFYETRENFAWKLQALSPDTGGLRTGLSGTGQEMKITGNAASDQFGYAMTTGDFNSDGKQDLAVGAIGNSKVYIFYDDGSLSAGANGADVTITSSLSFGNALVAGDFNADGRTDLAVGGRYNYRAYIFYNDGSYPVTSAAADVIIVGSDYFGWSLAAGDFNADGRTDLAVGDVAQTSFDGSVFIFYNDGSIPTTEATADVTITGETGGVTYFGYSLTAGDFNADGKTDLVAGAYHYSTSTGRAYIFYNDGSIPTTAATADVIITGEGASYFGYSMTAGDLNSDGKTDLAVGGSEYNSATGRAYIFYADGTNNFGTATCSGSPSACSASNADVIITGEGALNDFAISMTVGDFNGDGRTDLAVGAKSYSSSTGRAYIFYNDGSIPTTAATADVILTGETMSNYFGFSLAAGDLNGDGRIDLVVGAYGYSGSRGRTYIYTLNDPVITGETTNNSFGSSLVSGDFNSDGKIDLAVGAPGYSTNTGRVYIFYQDGTIPSTAATADVIITGEATGNYFSGSLTGLLLGNLVAGDFNSDGRTDLAVGAPGYSSSTGRAYIFYNDGVSFGTAACTTGCLASNADVIITGQGGNNRFGYSLAAGDLNSDGRTDLIVGTDSLSGYVDKAYIFYNDGVSFGTAACSTGCLAANADILLTSSANDNFGWVLATGDFNSDGRTDLAVGAGYNASPAIYIFYNDGSLPTTAQTADVTIAGVAAGNNFGSSIVSGDFNADGRIDLAVSSSGITYIFYNDGSYPASVASADITISNAGGIMTVGDFNADGRTDIAISATYCSTNTGCVYIFYNDGSLPTTAATADVTLIGEATNNYFGQAITTGDFNSDGVIDLAVGAYGYSTNTGRVYLFTSEAAVTSSPSATGRVRGVGKLRGTATLR